MRGLEKNRMGTGQISKNDNNTRRLRLLDHLGPEGPVGKNIMADTKQVIFKSMYPKIGVNKPSIIIYDAVNGL